MEPGEGVWMERTSWQELSSLVEEFNPHLVMPSLPGEGPRVINILLHYSSPPRNQMVKGTHECGSCWSALPGTEKNKIVKNESGQGNGRIQHNTEVMLATSQGARPPATVCVLPLLCCFSTVSITHAGTLIHEYQSITAPGWRNKLSGQLGQADAYDSFQLCAKGFIFYQELAKKLTYVPCENRH